VTRADAYRSARLAASYLRIVLCGSGRLHARSTIVRARRGYKDLLADDDKADEAIRVC
jgi:hypothetical protein